MSYNNTVDVLILGAGWISQFLIPVLENNGMVYAKTTRQGGSDSIKFNFDPESSDPEAYYPLPSAKSVLIVFPIKIEGGSRRLLECYNKTHPGSAALFIQLGSSGIWTIGDLTTQNPWIDRRSPFNQQDSRARAEEELLMLCGEGFSSTVLNLAGLWGGDRSFRNWVSRVAPTKSALEVKKSVHAIHGLDVARSILAVHTRPDLARGQRWLLTDGRVYDWWDLASAWGPLGGHDVRIHAEWVRELMQTFQIRALPRAPDILERTLDSQDFWRTFELSPLQARLE